MSFPTSEGHCSDERGKARAKHGAVDMSEVKVPDIGDFDEVPVIEIHVSEGDEVEVEQALVTLESDKATMDVPSPEAGTVKEVLVKVNDKVSEGTPIVVLEGDASEAGSGTESSEPEQPAADEVPDTTDPEAPEPGSGTESAEAEQPAEDKVPDPSEPEGKRVVVVGSGPGGYTAAFRAADLGLEVTLVERHERIGGVCLNVGCIPSKALLHAAKVVAEAEEAAEFGLTFSEPEIDLDKLRSWKEDVVGKLIGGLGGLAKKRKVNVVHGEAKFTSENELEVGGEKVGFDHAIIAAGSRAVMLPDLPDDERIVDSTGALELPDIPETLLVIGGGIIGLEMASVYEALGSKVTVVELTDQLIPGCDPDLVKPLAKRVADRYEAIHLDTKVSSVEVGDGGIKVSFEGDKAPDAATFDRVLVAVGLACQRRPARPRGHGGRGE